MSAFLTEVDSWVTAAVLAAAMLAAWSFGRWQGRRLSKTDREAAASKFNDASLALLGLLLAFTFSMALGKHDQRRQMVVSDSNAIGDFYTCVSLLKEPMRGQLQSLLREYVQQRLALATDPLDDAIYQRKLEATREMHNRMQALVGEAVTAGTPVTIPLVNSLNELTSSHASRMAALSDRLAPSIVFLLALAAILSLVLVGRQHGALGERELVGTIGFIVLVSLVVWVTLDLNQPHRGWITVSQEPMRQLLSGMGQ
jgi:hypothetical protein